MTLLWAADLRVCETWVGCVGEVADRIRSSTPQWVCPGLAATQATAWVSLWLTPPVLTPCAVGCAMRVVGSTEIAGGDGDGAAEPKCSLDAVCGCDVAAPSDGRPLRRWGVLPLSKGNARPNMARLSLAMLPAASEFA